MVFYTLEAYWRLGISNLTWQAKIKLHLWSLKVSRSCECLLVSPMKLELWQFFTRNTSQVDKTVLYCTESVVHNCTIFLCSLDVRNIVQGGDPLYAGFFSTQGSGGYTWPKWVRFFAKNNCLGCEPEKKNKFWWKKSFLWPREAVFCDLRSFPKNKDRSPKIRINLPTLSSAH